MRLVFIRHGDPDYEKDSLTQKGWREAELLSARVAKWKVTDFYVSPLGRAQDTAAVSLKKTGRKAHTVEWLQEFYYKVKDPVTGQDHIAWDWLPSFYTSESLFFDKDKWIEAPVLKTGPIMEKYQEVCNGIDEILERYGYERQGMLYRTDGSILNPNFATTDKTARYELQTYKKTYDDRTIVFFCHLGVMFVMLAHLLGISPVQLWQGFFVAPSSVTILNSEERVRGSSFFRVERMGDTQHLKAGGEPISSSGYFTDVLQEV
ncbi:MAG: histidine phosphatase family protein [Treponema sp.]|jgi:probable phosphoglycerate mutase|nr:histidine phosphatase family protein [Treponema sp.]